MDAERRELEVLANPELMDSIQKGIEDARQGHTNAEDFSQYLRKEEPDA